MKEQLHTIPLNDAFLSGDECPFCYLRRQAEQSALRFTAGPGASYMETEVREATNATGFCREHMKKVYDYGNTLGSALILQTHFSQLIEDFQREAESFQAPPKKSLLKKRAPEPSLWPIRLRSQAGRCYICDKIGYNMERYYLTFFSLLKEPEFRERVKASKGFCLEHFGELLGYAEAHLPNAQRDWFYETILPLMEENLKRVKEDLDWLIAKYDYRNAGAPWKNSQDALQRTMQKLTGGYPADKPFRNE